MWKLCSYSLVIVSWLVYPCLWNGTLVLQENTSLDHSSFSKNLDLINLQLGLLLCQDQIQLLRQVSCLCMMMTAMTGSPVRSVSPINVIFCLFLRLFSVPRSLSQPKIVIHLYGHHLSCKGCHQPHPPIYTYQVYWSGLWLCSPVTGTAHTCRQIYPSRLVC